MVLTFEQSRMERSKQKMLGGSYRYEFLSKLLIGLIFGLSFLTPPLNVSALILENLMFQIAIVMYLLCNCWQHFRMLMQRLGSSLSDQHDARDRWLRIVSLMVPICGYILIFANASSEELLNQSLYLQYLGFSLPILTVFSTAAIYSQMENYEQCSRPAIIGLLKTSLYTNIVFLLPLLMTLLFVLTTRHEWSPIDCLYFAIICVSHNAFNISLAVLNAKRMLWMMLFSWILYFLLLILAPHTLPVVPFGLCVLNFYVFYLNTEFAAKDSDAPTRRSLAQSILLAFLLWQDKLVLLLFGNHYINLEQLYLALVPPLLLLILYSLFFARLFEKIYTKAIRLANHSTMKDYFNFLEVSKDAERFVTSITIQLTLILVICFSSLVDTWTGALSVVFCLQVLLYNESQKYVLSGAALQTLLLILIAANPLSLSIMGWGLDDSILFYCVLVVVLSFALFRQHFKRVWQNPGFYAYKKVCGL